MSEEPYRIGYRKPPRNRQFQPGQSGNPNGRRGKQRKPDDAVAWLDEPVPVRAQGELRYLSPRELAVRKQVEQALKDDDLKSLLHLLDLFEKHGEYAVPLKRVGGGVLVLGDRSMPFPMACIMAQLFGQGPWSEAELVEGRRAYRASRTPQQARIDAAIGYAALEGDEG